MKHLFAAFLCLAVSAALTAAPSVKETPDAVTLSGGGAEYRFTKAQFYQLTESKFKGKSLWIKGFGLTYNMPGDKWYWENKPDELYKMGPRTYRVIRKGDAVTLATRGEGKNMTLIRDFTMRGDSPALEVRIRLEIRNENRINWLNLFSTSCPVKDEFWLPVSRVRGGGVSTLLEKVESPFLDPETGKFRYMGTRKMSEQKGMTCVCSYSPAADAGAVMMQMPRISRLSMRVGMARENSTGIYCNVSPYHFEGTEKESFLESAWKVVPFTGSPARLNEDVIPRFVAEMQSFNALPRSVATGTTLVSGKDLAVWSDLVSQKVYPSAPAPAKKGGSVELSAARAEGEGFQLALRSAAGIEGVTWQVTGIPFETRVFPVGLTRREYFRGICGDHPDVLLEETSLDLAPGTTRSLYVKVSVPENGKPGVYRGKVTLSAQGKALCSVPVTLTVRDFSIEKRTLTAAWDSWWRKFGFSKDRNTYLAERAKIEKMAVDARGGGRWLDPVKVTFDAEGNLVKADYSAFDKSVKRYTQEFKQPLLITRSFMLGYGHQLRKNLFGEAKDILTPLWKKKVVSFAKDFRKHLQELKINDRIIMDLFDEPYDDSFKALRETVALLRSVAPEWRFTYAGNYAPALKDVINFWNVGCNAPERELAAIRAAGSECSFYNPPGYGDNGELTKIRGYYTWLRRAKVIYVYQWVINCWGEVGNRGWDDFRCASWVVPSPKGPLSTLRMENTREGIEDYEYGLLLEKECARLAKKAPRLAEQGRKLLKLADTLAGRAAGDPVGLNICGDPGAYDRFHREAGALLEKMAAVK